MESCLCSYALRSASFSGRDADLGCSPVHHHQQQLQSSFVALTCGDGQGSYLHRGFPPPHSHSAADCLTAPKAPAPPRAALLGLHDKGRLAHAAGASRCSAILEDWQSSLWEASARPSASRSRLAAKATSAGSHSHTSHRVSRAPPQGHSTPVTDGSAASARNTSSRRRCTNGIHTSSTSSSSSSSSSPSSSGRWPFLFSDDLGVLSSSHSSPKRRPRSRPGPPGSGTSAHAHALLEGPAAAAEAWGVGVRGKALSQKCTLEAAAFCQPLPAIGGRGNGDAHLIEGNWVGVADGIRGWAEQGVNSGLYCQELLWNCAEAIRGSGDFSDSDEEEAPTPKGARGRRHSGGQAQGQGQGGCADGLSPGGAGRASLAGAPADEGGAGGSGWEEGLFPRDREGETHSGSASTSASHNTTHSATHNASHSATHGATHSATHSGTHAATHSATTHHGHSSTSSASSRAASDNAGIPSGHTGIPSGPPNGSTPPGSPGKKKRTGGPKARRAHPPHPPHPHLPLARSPKEVLEEGHMRTELQGSCTATLATLQGEVLQGGSGGGALHIRTQVQVLQGSCAATLATLQGEFLSIANVGDSGFLLVRGGEIVARSLPMQHDFDAPFQIGLNVGDGPTCAMEYRVEVVPGDVLVLGTDGLLDNLFPVEIALIVGEAQGEFCGPEAVAKRLATAAYRKSQSADSFTPFGEGARVAGRPHVGGKADDITALVAFVR